MMDATVEAASRYPSTPAASRRNDAKPAGNGKRAAAMSTRGTK